MVSSRPALRKCTDRDENTARSPTMAASVSMVKTGWRRALCPWQAGMCAAVSGRPPTSCEASGGFSRQELLTWRSSPSSPSSPPCEPSRLSVPHEGCTLHTALVLAPQHRNPVKAQQTPPERPKTAPQHHPKTMQATLIFNSLVATSIKVKRNKMILLYLCKPIYPEYYHLNIQ